MLQTENQTAATDEGLAWRMAADSLTRWALAHMVNRPDAYGKYYVDRDGKPGSCKQEGAIDYGLVHRHFAAEQIVGLYTTSAGDTCRWLAIDLDRHDDDPDDFVEKNDRLARDVFDRLRAMGFHPLLLDSNGKGGRHLFVLLADPEPARVALAFGNWLVREWATYGLAAVPEVFPKQDTITKKDGSVGYGNFVRLLGRHYKKPFYSKVWDGSTWLTGQEAIDHVLGLEGDPVSLVPPESTTCVSPPTGKATTKKAARRPDRSWIKKYEGDLTTLDIAGLFEDAGLRVRDTGGGQFEVECPWAHEHSDGRDGAYILDAKPGEGLFPTYFCHHAHCEGRTIADVLDFFGRKAVDGRCRETFRPGGRPRKVVIDLGDPMAVAKVYHKQQGGTLVHHKDAWWRWDGRKYAVVPEHDMRADLWNWLAGAETTSGKRPGTATVGNVLDALKAHANVPATVEMPAWLDGDGPDPQNVIAFDNGLLDLEAHLRGEVKLVPHTRRWLSANCLPHAFDPKADCPLWLRKLDEWFGGDEERVRALAMFLGYCMTCDTRQHKMAWLIGPPRSGKSTVARVFGGVIGTHNVANPTLTSLGGRFGLAPLVGKLVAIIADGHLGKASDAVAVLERLKSISGGDPQNIDRKNAAELTNEELYTRFIVAVNELPRLPDASAALARRMIIFPFDHSFEGREDFDLTDRLLAEAPGITNWGLRGLLDLRETGRLIQPEAGRAVLRDFERLSSPVRAFVEDCCVLGPGHSVPKDVLRAAWRGYCDDNGHQPGGDSSFGTKLRAIDNRVRATRSRPVSGGGQVHMYAGIDLVSRPPQGLLELPF
jgi:putative DNA primase/helicase